MDATTSGSVSDQLVYDSYGNIVSETSPSSGDRFKFTGREWDAELGLYYYRNRFYGAADGRFETEDPTGFSAGDLDLYRYVGNSPTNAADPTGLETIANVDLQTFFSDAEKDLDLKLPKAPAFGKFDLGKVAKWLGGLGADLLRVPGSIAMYVVLDYLASNKKAAIGISGTEDHSSCNCQITKIDDKPIITGFDLESNIDFGVKIPVLGDVAKIGYSASFSVKAITIAKDRKSATARLQMELKVTAGPVTKTRSFLSRQILILCGETNFGPAENEPAPPGPLVPPPVPPSTP
jgi:RHS repeat-associated protein